MLPYPVLFVSLVIFWMTLNSFSPGHLLLGSLVALVASWGLASLRPSKPRLTGWYLMPRLIGIVLYDVVLSNLSVARVILSGRKRRRRPGFMTVRLELKDQTALAVLSVILTSTPGTAWLEYNSANGHLLMHVLDLVDEEGWRDVVKNRYEKLLMEIFE